MLQIDSVNVFARSHYMPLFSRLGDYDPALLDRAVLSRPSALRPGRYTEYIAHEATFLPVEDWPLWGFRREAFLLQARRVLGAELLGPHARLDPRRAARARPLAPRGDQRRRPARARRLVGVGRGEARAGVPVANRRGRDRRPGRLRAPLRPRRGRGPGGIPRPGPAPHGGDRRARAPRRAGARRRDRRRYRGLLPHQGSRRDPRRDPGARRTGRARPRPGARLGTGRPIDSGLAARRRRAPPSHRRSRDPHALRPRGMVPRSGAARLRPRLPHRDLHPVRAAPIRLLLAARARRGPHLGPARPEGGSRRTHSARAVRLVGAAGPADGRRRADRRRAAHRRRVAGPGARVGVELGRCRRGSGRRPRGASGAGAPPRRGPHRGDPSGREQPFRGR